MRLRFETILWGGDELTTVDGQFHVITAGAIRPRPRRQIPIWIGGHAPVALKRAAAIADGLMLEHSLEEAPEVIVSIRDQLVENGRDPNGFGFAARIDLSKDGLDVAIKEASAWSNVGITHLSVNTMDQGTKDPDEHITLARAFIVAWRGATHIGPRL